TPASGPLLLVTVPEMAPAPALPLGSLAQAAMIAATAAASTASPMECSFLMVFSPGMWRSPRAPRKVYALFRRRAYQSSGCSLTIDAPWLLPTQKVTGVVELSTKTRRTLVGRGSRYSTEAPVFVSIRTMRSLDIEPLHSSPLRSTNTS